MITVQSIRAAVADAQAAYMSEMDNHGQPAHPMESVITIVHGPDASQLVWDAFCLGWRYARVVTYERERMRGRIRVFIDEREGRAERMIHNDHVSRVAELVT